MSAPLPGNPFLLEAFRGTGADLAIASSSYAVAHELRTANLIAYARHIDDADTDVLAQIAERLGLRDEGGGHVQ